MTSIYPVNQRILLLHPEGNSFNNPSLICIIDLLLEKNIGIDLRYARAVAPMPECQGIKLWPYGRMLKRIKSVVFDKISAWPLMYVLVLLESIFLYKRYDLIIGVDRQGLIEASILSDIKKTPYVFISFEITCEDETSRRYKLPERKASKNVKAWLIQDEVRAELLQRENHLPASSKFILPLASAGTGELATQRLRDHIGIAVEKKVAIAIGSISDWSMTNHLLRCVVDWPDDWVLIIHDRNGKTYELLHDELPSLSRLLGSKFFISDAATEKVDAMGSILSGVSAGLAFYQPNYKRPLTGKNLEYLGLASGKISTYLRYGIPVIMNEIGLYADEARQFKFGCVVEQPRNIKDCFEGICNKSYQKNAINYFNAKLNFNIYKNDVFYNFLGSLTPSS